MPKKTPPKNQSPSTEELMQWVLWADLDRLVEALAPLDEAQRSALEDTAIAIWWDLGESPLPEGLVEIRRTVSEDHWQRIIETARLTLVAVLRKSKLRDLGLWSLDGPTEDGFVRILDDRRPPWLQSWFEQQFQRGLPENSSASHQIVPASSASCLISNRYTRAPGTDASADVNP